MSWAALERQAPDLARVGWRLFRGDAVPIGFLATLAADGRPRMAPVCPIFAAGDVHLSVGAHTVKLGDLRRDGRYALHAFLGTDDEEFQIAGRAAEVTDTAARAAIQGAIRFAAYEPADPIFRLDLERAVWVRWERPGTPEMRAIRASWTAASGVIRRRTWSPRAARRGNS